MAPVRVKQDAQDHFRPLPVVFLVVKPRQREQLLRLQRLSALKVLVEADGLFAVVRARREEGCQRPLIGAIVLIQLEIALDEVHPLLKSSVPWRARRKARSRRAPAIASTGVPGSECMIFWRYGSALASAWRRR